VIGTLTENHIRRAPEGPLTAEAGLRLTYIRVK